VLQEIRNLLRRIKKRLHPFRYRKESLLNGIDKWKNERWLYRASEKVSVLSYL
jgi:hypothetical protein